MSNSTIDIVFDVTERAKEIFARENGGQQGHGLINVDKDGKNEPINSYFTRGATSIVDGEVFDREKYAGATDASAISEIDMQYKKKFIEMNPVFGNIGKYKMQNFIYNTAGMFNIALGQDSFYYKPRFSNGKVCHIWKENINGEDHLCILNVEDGLSIEIPTANDDREKYYMPGAVILEIKVPVSVLQNMEPITDKHITRVLVTSGKLFDLLDVNPNLISLLEDDSTEKGKELKKTINSSLESRGSKEPLQNLGNQIKEPNFKDQLPEAVNRKRVKSYFLHEEKPEMDAGLDDITLENENQNKEELLDLENYSKEPNFSRDPSSPDSGQGKNISSGSSDESEELFSEIESPPAISPLRFSEEEKPKSSDSGLYFRFFNKVVRSRSNDELGDKTFTLTDTTREKDVRPGELFFNKSSPSPY